MSSHDYHIRCPFCMRLSLQKEQISGIPNWYFCRGPRRQLCSDGFTPCLPRSCGEYRYADRQLFLMVAPGPYPSYEEGIWQRRPDLVYTAHDAWVITPTHSQSVP